MRQPAASLVVINAENPILGRDRRSIVRHRPQTPAYANLNGSSLAAPLEFCEILDISERGMCIQASATMKLNRLLPLVLDLSQTKARLHTTGHVVWSDSSGRTGIRFPEMPEASKAEVQRWLAVDASAGLVDPFADPDAPATATAKPVSYLEPVTSRPSFAASYSSMIAEWAAIEKEVDICGPDVEPALQMLAHRALTLTWASGAAIALMNKLRPSELICVARSGTDSPELGERIQAGSGFSAECVRAAAALRCDDVQTDPRVDRDSCRALGINSLIACPIKRRNGEVIGIVEVFSPEPAAFWDNDSTILERLSRIIANAVHRVEHTRPDLLVFDTPVEEEPSLYAETLDSLESQVAVAESSETRNLLLFATGLVAVCLTTWLVAPWIDQAFTKVSHSSPPTAEASPSVDPYIASKLPELKKMAEDGKPAAQYSLAMRYATGDGVLQNYHEAVGWFLKAADRGDTRATSKLAACFWAGRGASQDYSKAYFWGLLAQAAGDETGRIIVINSAPHLSPAHIAREQEAAEKWLHDHQISSHSSQE